MRAALVVLSDLGLSPRMLRHARAWAASVGEVDLVGFDGRALEPGIDGQSRLTIHRLHDRRATARSLKSVNRFVLASARRAASALVRALRLLFRLPRPDVVLVANPPAVPALAVGWLVARLRGARFIIDWSDLSHRRAAAQLGESHRLVRSIERSERRWARRADGHLAASAALAEWLQREYGVSATVVYDRPSVVPETVTVTIPGIEANTRLVVCPTNWTANEDFDLLLEALERADRLVSKEAAPARLTVLLTGTGEMRSAFEARLSRRRFANIVARVADVDARAAIRSAAAGLCLHQSASGVDLPMVLTELRGAGVPACVYDYSPVLREVLTVGHEGVTFGEPGELAALLVAIATGDATTGSALARSRAWLSSHPAETWEEHWQQSLQPVLGRNP